MLFSGPVFMNTIENLHILPQRHPPSLARGPGYEGGVRAGLNPIYRAFLECGTHIGYFELFYAVVILCRTTCWVRVVITSLMPTRSVSGGVASCEGADVSRFRRNENSVTLKVCLLEIVRELRTIVSSVVARCAIAFSRATITVFEDNDGAVKLSGISAVPQDLTSVMCGVNWSLLSRAEHPENIVSWRAA